MYIVVGYVVPFEGILISLNLRDSFIRRHKRKQLLSAINYFVYVDGRMDLQDKQWNAAEIISYTLTVW